MTELGITVTYHKEKWFCFAVEGLGKVVVDERQDTPGQWACLGPESSTSTPLKFKMELMKWWAVSVTVSKK